MAQAAGVDINTRRRRQRADVQRHDSRPGVQPEGGRHGHRAFQDNIAHATGIHWHGIELHNAHDGTPLTQNQVQPGDSISTSSRCTRPGIYWYHPHHHSSTNQVFKGTVRVDHRDRSERRLARRRRCCRQPRRRGPWCLSDITVCKAPGDNDDDLRSRIPCRTCSGARWIAAARPHPGRAVRAPAPLDEDGTPRGPFAAGDVPNIQKPGRHDSAAASTRDRSS